MKHLLSVLIFLCSVSLASATPEYPFFAVCMDTHDSKKRSLDEQSQMLSELGFAGMLHFYPNNIPERKATAEKHALKLVTVYMGINLSKPVDPNLGKALACLKDSGTMLALTIEGGKPSDAALDDKVVQVLREVLNVTEPLKIRVLIYPHVRSWNETVGDCVRIAKRFPNKEIGVMFNLCHWAAADKTGLETALRESAPYLGAITINGMDEPGTWDFNKDGWKRGILPLDEGTFDMNKLLKILKEIDYHGPVGLQCWGIPGDVRIHLEKSIKKWKSLP
ncbi:hypothetical protein FACS189419_04690 [Planctomycetales bacterium]|nr:hypothetical protein FACS189419_04690 [Planctomycetales bacterium]